MYVLIREGAIEFFFKNDGPDSGIQLEIYFFIDSATNEQIVQIKISFSSEYISRNTSKIISLVECFDLYYSDN